MTASGSTGSPNFLPYPLDTDPVDVAGDIELLANQTSGRLNTKIDNVLTTIGDTLYASTNGTPYSTVARVAGNTSTTRAFLGQTGTGTASAAPSWTSSVGTGNVVLATSPTIITPTILDILASTTATADLWSEVTTGSITIGAGLTTGTINIAAAGTGATSINIGHTNATTFFVGSIDIPIVSAVALGTNASGVIAAATTSGTGSTIILQGSPTITTPTIDSINVSTSSTAATLWNTTVTTGSISIGGSISGGSINIGNGAVTGNKTIGIGTSATAGTTAITIGSNSGATSTIALNGAVTVGGDMTINGTLTTINSNSLNIDDKNIEIGGVTSGTVSTTGTVGSITGTGPWTATITGMTDTADLIPGSAITATNGTGSLGAGGTYIVASVVSNTSITYTATGGTTPVAGTVTNITTTGATDTTANGGGLILKGTTDKTILWDSANTNWTSSEHWNLVTGKVFKINNTQVLSNTAVLGLTPTINATGFRLSGGTTPKYVQINNDIILAGTDGSTLNIGAGGTLGSAAFTASSAYEPAFSTLAISKGGTGTGTAPTQNGIIYASSATAYASTAAGTTGQVLAGNTSAAPSWVNASTLSVSSASTATTATNLSGTTQYSIPYQTSSATTGYLNIGLANQILTVNGTATGYTWTSPFINPMTTLGDMVYGGASGASTRLANAGTTNGVYILQQTVTGGAATAPSWLGTTGTGNVVLATSPTLSGTPLSTTASADTNTTQIATTAFVIGQASATTPLAASTAAIGTSLRYARADHVHPNTVATPITNNEIANKGYVDTAIANSVTITEEIIPLDDISNYFDGAETRFAPRYQGDLVSILNPFRLLLTINGIIQYVNTPEYVWMSGVPQRGFFVDSDGYLQFSEAVPAGSEFDARIMSGNATTTRTRVYPFKPLDILLGG